MRKILVLISISLLASLTLVACSKESVKVETPDNTTVVNSKESLSMQSELTSEEQSKQDALLESGSTEIKETLVPNVYADVTVKPAITAGDVEVGVGHTALFMIKTQSAGKFELKGYFEKEFTKEEYLSIAIPMDKVGSFKASFTPNTGEQIVIATVNVK